ncbi:oocyte-secreted protein 2 [Arvicola amphibius]|uniref:oocyte-secreted protein 2 n=1 Tax=Arvicola amphibius TaxID=1047088 RepID=UPI0018E3ED03|nr:oocyte-secreted protein 2 [Arvicola amphibius]
MKVSVALEVLVLSAVLVWPCAWNIDINVKINCSLDWMMVYVSPDAQDRDNPYIYSDELILGQGCPATKIHAYQYDFVYPVGFCGIRTKVISKDTIHFETEMYFVPRNSHFENQTIPLECSASRKSVWLTAVSTDKDPKVPASIFMTDLEITPEDLGLLNVF